MNILFWRKELPSAVKEETIKKLTKKEKRSLVNVIKSKLKKVETNIQHSETPKAVEETKMEQKQETQESKGFEKNQPIIETSINLSKDKKFVIHRTVITDIKPKTYYEKVME